MRLHECRYRPNGTEWYNREEDREGIRTCTCSRYVAAVVGTGSYEADNLQIQVQYFEMYGD